MDPVHAAAADDGPLRWLRVMLAVSVLAPALVFIASAWLDYGQTLAIGSQQVDRTVRIAHEHALKVFETSELIIGRVEELVGDRSSDALRADRAALDERLAAVARSVPQVQAVFVLDADGLPLAASPATPDALGNRPETALLQRVRAGDGFAVSGALVPGGQDEPVYTVAKRREIDGRFAGVIGVSLHASYLNDFYRELTREFPAVALVLYREDGAVLTRYPDPPSGAESFGPRSRWRQLVARGAPVGVQKMQAANGERSLAAVRRIGNYPIYLGAAISYRTLEREWIDKVGVILGFAVAAMVALGAVSWMALRAARDERAATGELRREAARRAAAEKALRESQRMEAMGQLTGGVAHDFNNLLMIVNGNVQILRKRLDAGAHGRQLDAIGDAMARGVTLTRHLLAFSRRQALSPRTIDLGEVMPSLCELLTHSLRENIRLHCRVAPGTWPIRADRGELELALINIAVNARDAMPGGGTLTIAARNATANDLLQLGGEMSGEFVLIALHDSGDGVPPEVLGRVFEPFFTTKAPGHGTGLGLSQVYGFTRQSGGTVTLQSPPGRGTTVTLWLPRSTEPLAGRATAPGTPVRMGQGTLLVVEDDTAVAAVLRELLEQLGYAVRIATSGAEALEQLASGVHFDLVLTDVVMVGKPNGLELARLVRVRHPDLPLIVMTGYTAEIARISDEGFTVLTKPFELETLARAIDAKLAHEAVPGA